MELPLTVLKDGDIPATARLEAIAALVGIGERRMRSLAYEFKILPTGPNRWPVGLMIRAAIVHARREGPPRPRARRLPRRLS